MIGFERRWILAGLLFMAFVTGAEPGLAQDDRDIQASDTLRYVQIVDGRPIGSWRAWQEGPNTWGYTDDRFNRFDRTEHWELDASGLPIRLDARGRIRDGIPWYERLERHGDTLRWFTPRTRGEATVAGPAFYATVYRPIDPGLPARALLGQPSRTLRLLPEGEIRLESLGEREAEAGGQSRTVRLFAVHGLELYPTYVWLDEGDATFADEWSVLEGWEDAFPSLRIAVDEAIAGHRRALARELLPRPRARHLVIRGARLFDPETGEVRGGTTIRVEGSRVTEVGPDGTVDTPDTAEVIEAAGRMALPGLWDVHAHLRNPAYGQMFDRGGELLHLAGGVTSVRDVGSHVGSLLALRKAIEAGEAVGPRIVAAGFVYDTTLTDVIEHPVATVAEARAAVDRYASLGFPQIKLHIVSDSELVRAAVTRAEELGMQVTGHLPDDMTSREAIETGYDEMMHLWWIVWTIRWTNEEAIAAGETFESWHQVLAELPPEDPAVRELVQLLVASGTAVDPTIGYFLSDDTPPEFIADAVDRLPAPVARYLRHKPWQADYFPRSPLSREARERAVENLLALLPVLHESGVRVLPGSDTWAGFGLHYELEVHADAGVPAPDVLALATLGAAREMGMADDLGTIAPGKLADLILVDGDPSTDIRDIRRVVTVVKDGRVYDPAAIYRALGIEPCCGR